VGSSGRGGLVVVDAGGYLWRRWAGGGNNRLKASHNGLEVGDNAGGGHCV
jgi:hypothetical protein